MSTRLLEDEKFLSKYVKISYDDPKYPIRFDVRERLSKKDMRVVRMAVEDLGSSTVVALRPRRKAQ